MNTLRTIVLMGFLTALAVALGGVLGGKQGLIIAFVFALVTNIGSYWYSDKLALMFARAQPVSREEAPELYEMVERLCRRANMPVPSIYITPDAAPNAFATGRDPEHAAVAVTAGIMRILNQSELEAVLAHELAHVKNRDILITSIGSVLASVVTMIAHFGFYFGGSGDREEGGNPIFALMMVILAPIAASLVNLAISRTREYQADATGAEICGQPQMLASALAKLDAAAHQIPLNVNPAMGNMFTVKPGAGGWLTNMMSTHPPIHDRIERLQEIAKKLGGLSYRA